MVVCISWIIICIVQITIFQKMHIQEGSSKSFPVFSPWPSLKVLHEFENVFKPSNWCTYESDILEKRQKHEFEFWYAILLWLTSNLSLEINRLMCECTDIDTQTSRCTLMHRSTSLCYGYSTILRQQFIRTHTHTYTHIHISITWIRRTESEYSMWLNKNVRTDWGSWFFFIQ